ncbi:MAG: glycosyltransferase family 39 protein [Acidobacteriota bacterium]
MDRGDDRAADRRFLILAMGLLGVFLISRLWGLGSWVHLLNDESIELHRALLIHADLGNLWLPNVEYKPPLFYWLAAVMVAVFDDPIIALRTISVGASLLTLVVLMFFAWRTSGRRTALLAAFLYVLSPHGLVFDRTGLMETFLAFLVFSSFVVLAVGRAGLRPDLRSVFAGMLLGLAFFTKQSALLFFPFPLLWTLLDRRGRLSAWAGLGVIYATAALFVVLFVIAPDVPSIWAARNISGDGTSAVLYHGSYRLSPSEILGFPWAVWYENAATMMRILAEQFTIPIVVLALLGGLVSRSRKSASAVFLYAVIPVFLMLIIANGMSGRAYMFPFLIAPLSILAADAIVVIGSWLSVRFGLVRGRITTAFIVGVIVATALGSDIPLLLRPIGALEGMTEGVLAPAKMSEYRVSEAADLLTEIAEKEPIWVLTDLSFGMPTDGLAVSLWGRDEVALLYCWWVNSPTIPLVPEGSIEVYRSNHHRTSDRKILRGRQLHSRPVYWITNSLRYPAEFVRLKSPESELVFSLPSPDGSSLDLYLVSTPTY